MTAALEQLPAGDIVVLHACCHNPTGADLTPDQWTRVIDIVKSRGLVPILDIAYQGFAEGLAQDGAVVKRFSDAMSPVFICSSFSKSFSLYGERVGALTVTASRMKRRVMSQPASGAHQLFNPPTHGCKWSVLTTGTARNVG
jgi:aromatic-amino-acid transaminase